MFLFCPVYKNRDVSSPFMHQVELSKDHVDIEGWSGLFEP